MHALQLPGMNGPNTRGLLGKGLSAPVTPAVFGPFMPRTCRIFNISSPSRTVATLSMVFPFRFQQSLPLNLPATWTIRSVTAKTIAGKNSILATLPPEDPESKDIVCGMLKSNTYTGSDWESSVRDQIITFRTVEHKTILESMIWAIHSLSQPKNRHIQPHLSAEIHTAFLSGVPTAITNGQIPCRKYFSRHVRGVSSAPSCRSYPARGGRGYGPRLGASVGGHVHRPPSFAINKRVA